MADLDLFSTENSTVGGSASGTIGSELTASLDVLRDSLYDVDSLGGIESDSQASLVDPLTASLDVSKQSLTSTELTGGIESDSQASLVDPLTASLDVSKQSLTSTELTGGIESDSQASLADLITASLEVSVNTLTSIAEDGGIVAAGQASIADLLTASLNVNVAVLPLDSAADSEVTGTATGTVGSDLTATLEVVVGSLISIDEIGGVESDSQASLADPLTASIEVSVQSLTSVNEIGGIESDSQATVADPLTTGLQVNVSVLGLEATNASEVSGTASATIGSDLTASLDVLRDSLYDVDSLGGIESDAQASLADPLTASIEVSVQSLTSAEEIANIVSASQASLADLLTVSLDVSKDSLNSTEEIANIVSASQASLADPLTASIEVSVQSLTSVNELGGIVATGQASIADPQTASLDVNVAVLGLLSTADSVVSGTCNLSIATPLTSTEDGQVTGSGNLRKSQFVDTELQAAVAATYTVTTGPSVTIKGTETRTADLDIAVAAITTVDADLNVTVKGTETRTAGLQILKQTTGLLTPSLDITVAVTSTLTADLNQIVKVTQFRYADLDVHPSPTREFWIPTDLLVKGEFTRTADLSMAVQGTVLKTAALDLVVLRRLPYGLMRIYGDVQTRYLGGNPSVAGFPEDFNPHPAAVVNEGIGVFSDSDRHVAYRTGNQIPTPSVYDKYSVPLGTTVDTGLAGTRLLFGLELISIGPNNILLLGAFNGTNDPVTDVANGDLMALGFEVEKGMVHVRGWAGTNDSSRAYATGLPVERFLHVPLLVEIETVAATAALATVAFRLYDRSVSLSRPLLQPIELITSTAPTVTHVGMTSLGRRVPEHSTVQDDMQVGLYYVDVEPSAGSEPYEQSHLFEAADAKFRLYQDRPPVELSNAGPLYLYDALTADRGYWRLSTDTPTTLTFGGGVAALEGVVYADTPEMATADTYRVSVDARATTAFGVGVHGVGDTAAGDSITALAVPAGNSIALTSTLGGVTTTLATVAYTLNAGQWYRLELDARQRLDGDLLVNVHVDGTLVTSQIDTNGSASGAAMLYGTGSAEFRNLEVRGGVNTVAVELSDDGVAVTDTQRETAFVDPSDPIVTIDTFTTDSPVIVPDSVNPQIVKGSLQAGYSGVAMSWYATHAGTWSLRVDSTGVLDGTEIRSGQYPVPFALVSTGWDFSELPQVDRVYDVTLYLIADSGRSTAKRLGEFILP